MSQRQNAIDIFLAGVERVKPDNLIHRFVSVDDNKLLIENLSFDLSLTRNIFVVGAGKASAMMARSMEAILGSRISDGHIVTKYHHAVPLKQIKITEAGHPVPDENGVNGTNEIISIVKNAGKDDLVICLISGGGSALLADVPKGCTLEDIRKVNAALLSSGANIMEMNCIRKHLSSVKGGLLAKAASPASVVSLILSDVIGDPLDVIASGPTAPDSMTFGDALSILGKYGIEHKIPARVLQILQEGQKGHRQETLKAEDEILLRTHNLIIGSNRLALAASKEKAESLGFETRIISNNLDGDVSDVANFIVETIVKHRDSGKCCLLFGGEPTVKVAGKGLGGRNQHLALLLAKALNDIPGIGFLSGGTDGTDGPTDAAGAFADSGTKRRAKDILLDIDQYINDFDAYNFFSKEGGLLITGPTQTNVMDLMVALIDNT